MNSARARLERRRRIRRQKALLCLMGFVLVAAGTFPWRAETDELPLAVGGEDAVVDALLGEEPGREAPVDAGEGVGGPGDDRVGDRVSRPRVFVHEVRPGETLSEIAAAYGVDTATIAAANELASLDRIQVGQRLIVPSVKGALHTVRRGESLWDIARAYRVSMDEIIDANGLVQPDRLRVGEQLVIPGAQALAYAQQREALVDRDGTLRRNFDVPVRGRISSRFGPRWGRMHQGIDIAVPVGTPVRAAAAGRVTFSGWGGGYGYLVIVDHGHGIETRYAHNSRNVVRVGQRVRRGDILAYSGNTGNSTGPHVHFEIRRYGRALNPEHYFRR